MSGQQEPALQRFSWSVPRVASRAVRAGRTPAWQRESVSLEQRLLTVREDPV